MRAYLALFWMQSKLFSRYRMAALSGILTQLFWGILRVAVLKAFYRAASAPLPLDCDQSIAYIWLAQIMLCLVPWNVDKQLELQIKRGDVGYDLLKPVDLWSLWFTKACAMRLIPFLFRAVPLFALVALFRELSLPSSLLAWTGYLFSTLLAVLLSSSFTTMLHVTLMWTTSGEGITRLLPSIVALFSGLLVPLPLLPDWLKNVAYLLPLKGIIDTPFFFYMGLTEGCQALGLLAHQLVWIVALNLLSRWVLKRSLEQWEMAGG